jgi:hypothetical protein
MIFVAELGLLLMACSVRLALEGVFFLASLMMLLLVDLPSWSTIISRYCSPNKKNHSPTTLALTLLGERHTVPHSGTTSMLLLKVNNYNCKISKMFSVSMSPPNTNFFEFLNSKMELLHLHVPCFQCRTIFSGKLTSR